MWLMTHATVWTDPNLDCIVVEVVVRVVVCRKEKIKVGHLSLLLSVVSSIYLYF